MTALTMNDQYHYTEQFWMTVRKGQKNIDVANGKQQEMPKYSNNELNMAQTLLEHLKISILAVLS